MGRGSNRRAHLRKACVLANIAVGITVGPALGADTAWRTPADGDFADPSRWTGGVPGPGDRAIFDPGGTYNVSINSFHNSDQLLIGNDNVNLVFGYASSYQLGAPSASLVVGKTSGQMGVITFTNVGAGEFSAGEGILGDQAGSSGALVLNDSSDLALSGPLTVGNAGAGTLHINNPAASFASGDSVIGAQTGSTGTVALDSGQWLVRGNLMVGNQGNPAGHDTIHITNGNLNVTDDLTMNASDPIMLDGGFLTVEGAVQGTGTLHFNAGTLNIQSMNVTLNGGGVLGSSLTLDSRGGQQKSLYISAR